MTKKKGGGGGRPWYKKRRASRKRKGSVAVAAGVGVTALAILMDKGGTGYNGTSPTHLSIVECIQHRVPLNVLGDSALKSLTSVKNYIPAGVGVGTHFVVTRVLKANVAVSKNWMVA